jgi:hypothetical protein
VAGTQAAGHNVYFSTDIQDVMDGQKPVSTIDDSCYGPPYPGASLTGQLERDTTYYWRIDEVNDVDTPSLWAGDIWSFTTGDYYVVENFEDYEDSLDNQVWDTWIDGWEDIFNGSEIYLENWIAHGGRQSMQFEYGQYNIRLSEATVSIDDLNIGRDWTVGSPDTLSLWFYGDYWNDTDVQMYVKLNGLKVNYTGDSDDLIQTFWHRWDIKLADFGIKLNNIGTLTVGFERTETYGGYGVVYFDDICLYRMQK